MCGLSSPLFGGGGVRQINVVLARSKRAIAEESKFAQEVSAESGAVFGDPGFLAGKKTNRRENRLRALQKLSSKFCKRQASNLAVVIQSHLYPHKSMHLTVAVEMDAISRCSNDENRSIAGRIIWVSQPSTPHFRLALKQVSSLNASTRFQVDGRFEFFGADVVLSFHLCVQIVDSTNFTENFEIK